MSTPRQPFRENPAATAASADETVASPAKKIKASPATKVLTFAVSHSPVQVQLLESNTIFDLVDIICQSTTVGMNETVHAHIWDVKVPGITGTFNSDDIFVGLGNELGDCLRKATIAKLGDLGLEKGMTLKLKYDYGSTSYYDIYFLEENEWNECDYGDIKSFPREKPMKQPAGYSEFQTDQADLNAMFPTFNSFYTDALMPDVNLFQPGLKPNHGFVSRLNNGCQHMIFLPAMPGTDLSDYLHTIDYCCQFKYKTITYAGGMECPMNNFYSMVAFPHEYNKSHGHFDKHLDTGFCDMKKAPANSQPALNGFFPKVAALAGYQKDKKVPKGWISYKNKLLLICSGSAKSVHCKATPGTAFHGENQHQPESSQAVLFQTKVNIQSIHQLFCVTEGLLRTL